MSHQQSANTTHRKRLARRYADTSGLSYQQALAEVVAAAEAGTLPSPLDPSGMDAALSALMTTHRGNHDWRKMSARLDAVQSLPNNATTLASPSGVATLHRSPSTAKREETRLLALLEQRDGRVHIAGIAECRTALSLAEQGKVVIEDPSAITSEGGSGWVRAAAPESSQEPTVEPTVESTPLPQTWFVAHEGNPVPRCTGTSWRGNARQGKKPYGPGGFNRCVKEHGHSPEDGGTDPIHLDEWGHLFRMTPTFKVVRTITNAEMAEVARESGMAVGTHGSFKSKADAMKPNTLWMTSENEMVQLSNLYLNEDRVTASVVFPIPPRTTVRSYTLKVAASWKTPSAAQMRRYERAWGFVD